VSASRILPHVHDGELRNPGRGLLQDRTIAGIRRRVDGPSLAVVYVELELEPTAGTLKNRA